VVVLKGSLRGGVYCRVRGGFVMECITKGEIQEFCKLKISAEMVFVNVLQIYKKHFGFKYFLKQISVCQENE
jgi:hypothetical protein